MPFCQRTSCGRSFLLAIIIIQGGSPGLVVMGGDSYSMVVSSNPGTAYWIDIFSQIITVKIDLFLWKDKNNSKRGPFKKQL